MRCEKCGAILFENSRFCMDCGEPVPVGNLQNNNKINRNQKNAMKRNNKKEKL